MTFFDKPRDRLSYLARLESMSLSVQNQASAMLKNFDDLCVFKFKYKGDRVIKDLRTLKGIRLESEIFDLLQDYVNFLFKNNLGVPTIKNYTKNLKDYLTYLLEVKITSEELRRTIRYPKEVKERKYPLSHSELKKILDLSGDRKAHCNK